MRRWKFYNYENFFTLSGCIHFSLKKKKGRETESSVGDELSHGGALFSVASPLGAVALGALSLAG